MKVFKLVCPSDGNEFISFRESWKCECGAECQMVAEGEAEKLSQEVMEVLNEESTVKIVYRDGKKIIRKKRKKVPSTAAQRAAAENARQYAHTDEANKKRRKSLAARREDKLIGEV